jgi:hypothetical protein
VRWPTAMASVPRGSTHSFTPMAAANKSACVACVSGRRPHVCACGGVRRGDEGRARARAAQPCSVAGCGAARPSDRGAARRAAAHVCSL